MEVVRKYVDSQNLMSILSLPETFRNRKLEIIIHPVEEQAPDTIPDWLHSPHRFNLGGASRGAAWKI